MSQKRKAVAVLSGDMGPQAAALASSSSKRVKFDESAPKQASLEGEDTLGDLDIEEQDRKRMEPGRKGRVYAAGYDSDSDVEDQDDDDEDAGNRREEEGKQKRGDDDDDGDDDDMFGVQGSDDDADGGGKKQKGKGKAKDDGKKRFLELGEIEGQEFGTGDRERGEDGEEFDLEMDLEDTDDEDGEIEGVDFNREMDDERTPPTSPGGTVLRDAEADEAKARRLKKRKDKRTMGVKLEGFNMKTDMATGRFDEEGNYIENAKDPHAEHDKWLAGNYSRSKIRAAREAKEKREREAKEREAREGEGELGSPVGCMKGLCEMMEKGESVMEALQRLGKEARREKEDAKKVAKEEAKAARLAKKGAKKEQQQKEREDAAMDEGEEQGDDKGKAASTTPTAKPKSAISQQLERLTALSSALMARHGHTDVYEEEYETLLRVVRRSGEVGEDWDPAGERRRAAEAKEQASHGTVNGHEQTHAKARGREARYEYKWSPAYLDAVTSTQQDREEKEKQVFGPFARQEMDAWGQGGYFGDKRERVVVRVVESGTEGEGEWKAWKEVLG